MKRKNVIFWAVYAGFVLVLIAALIAGAGLLASWLDSFEQSQPVHSAEAVFKDRKSVV